MFSFCEIKSTCNSFVQCNISEGCFGSNNPLGLSLSINQKLYLLAPATDLILDHVRNKYFLQPTFGFV
jgi:hypothetical protein